MMKTQRANRPRGVLSVVAMALAVLWTMPLVEATIIGGAVTGGSALDAGSVFRTLTPPIGPVR